MKAFVMAAGVSLSVARFSRLRSDPRNTLALGGPPRPLPAREVKFPPYEVRTLENGLQVVAVLHHEQPVVSMRMLIRAGAASDPAQAGWPCWRRRSSTRHHDKSAREVNDEIRLHRGRDGRRRGTDLTFATWSS